MFLTSVKADSGDRSPWGNFWFSPVPFHGGSNNVTGDVALQLTAVYACVRNAAEDISTLPFIVKKIGKDGTKTQLQSHWLYRLFAKRPNAYQNPMEFREMMQGHLELRGNAFAEIFANSVGEVTDLIPIHPDRVTIEMLSDTNWRFVIKRLDGSEYRLSRAEMFHLKGLSSNGIIGYNPIQVARKAVATGLAAQDYGMRFFENDARPGGWIEHPNAFKTDEQRRLWRDRYQEMQAGRNKHKTAVFEFGMKYHELSVNNDEAQFIETKKYSVSDIARMWRMPPHMIGDLERSTNNNIENQSLGYVIYSMRPRVIRWEEAIKFSFLDPEDDSIEIEFSMHALLRGDLAARGTYINTRILNGSMTRNEGRLMEGDEPLPGLDEPLRPLNMVEENEAENGQAGQSAPAKQAPPDQNQSDARLVAMASAAADRVARKEAEMVQKAHRCAGPMSADGGSNRRSSEDIAEALTLAYQKHAPFVSSALGVPLQAAEAYCTDQIAHIYPEMSADDFAEIARCKLERLAIKGTV